MSTISKRLLDLAKSNLNSLLERAADQTDPRRRLANLSDTELEAELARRRTTRDAQRKIDEAKAHVVGGAATASGGAGATAAAGGAAQPASGAAGGASAADAAGAARTPGPGGAAKDRAERERQARAREEKVRAARDARDRVAQEQQARAREEQAKSQARGRSSSAGARGGAGFGFGGFGGGTGGRAGARAAAAGRNPDLAKHFAVLEVPNGSDWETVKAAYRKLMRKYHPDLHGGTPEKLKAATQVSQALTTAYNELEKALLGGPNRNR